ncbi:MAG: glycosyltransferase [Pseudomonadota bacterium]
MGVRNGAAHLGEQLQSIADQTHREWQLTMSDDGSDDDSTQIAEAFAADWSNRVAVSSGPQKGFAENFLSMVRGLPDEPGFVAFSDQDDVWMSEKLSRGMAALSAVDGGLPALYGSASYIWNVAAGTRVETPPLRRPASFANALVENFATGNTMILNPAAARLLRDASRNIEEVYAHDWWAYALISGCGGRVIHDREPTLLYRQHPDNEIGAGETLLRRIRRDIAVADGRYERKVGQQIRALRQCENLLTAENAAVLDAFASARTSSPALRRFSRIARSGVYRQSMGDSIGFYIAALIGKV